MIWLAKEVFLDVAYYTSDVLTGYLMRMVFTGLSYYVLENPVFVMFFIVNSMPSFRFCS